MNIHQIRKESKQRKLLQIYIRHRAATVVEKPRHIVQQCISGLPLLACTSHLPSYTASQRTIIGRVRKKAGQPSDAVNSLGDIAMPNSTVITSRGDKFLIWDSGADDVSRILVFETLQNLALLETNRNWFIDGSFKVSPSVFCQVFTIRANILRTTDGLCIASR